MSSADEEDSHRFSADTVPDTEVFVKTDVKTVERLAGQSTGT